MHTILIFPRVATLSLGGTSKSGREWDPSDCGTLQNAEDVFHGSYGGEYTVPYASDAGLGAGEDHPRFSMASTAALETLGLNIECSWLELDLDFHDAAGAKREWTLEDGTLETIISQFPPQFATPTCVSKSKHGWHAWWRLSAPLTPVEYDSLFRLTCRAFEAVGVPVDTAAGGWGRLLGTPPSEDTEVVVDMTAGFDVEPLRAMIAADLRAPQASVTPTNAPPVDPDEALAEAYVDGDRAKPTPEGRRLRARLAGQPGRWHALGEALSSAWPVDLNRNEAATIGMGWLATQVRLAGVAPMVGAGFLQATFSQTTAESGPPDPGESGGNYACWADLAMESYQKYWNMDAARLDDLVIEWEEVQEATGLPMDRLAIMQGRNYHVIDVNDPTRRTYLRPVPEAPLVWGLLKKQGLTEDEFDRSYLDTDLKVPKVRKHTWQSWAEKHAEGVSIVGASWSPDPTVNVGSLRLLEGTGANLEAELISCKVNAIEPRYDPWVAEYLTHVADDEEDRQALYAILEAWGRFTDRQTPALVLTGVGGTGKSMIVQALGKFATSQPLTSLVGGQFETFMRDNLIFTADDTAVIPENNNRSGRLVGDRLRGMLSSQPMAIDAKYSLQMIRLQYPWRVAAAQNSERFQRALSSAYSGVGESVDLEAIYRRVAFLKVSEEAGAWLRKNPNLEFQRLMREGELTLVDAREAIHDRFAQHVAWMAEHPSIQVPVADDSQERHVVSVTSHGQLSVYNQTQEDVVLGDVTFSEEGPTRVLASELEKLVIGVESNSMFVVYDSKIWCTTTAWRAMCESMRVELEDAKNTWLHWFKRDPRRRSFRILQSFCLKSKEWKDSGREGKDRYYALELTASSVTRLLNSLPEAQAVRVSKAWTTAAKSGLPPKEASSSPPPQTDDSSTAGALG